jgi:hypothetical protein
VDRGLECIDHRRRYAVDDCGAGKLRDGQPARLVIDRQHGLVERPVQRAEAEPPDPRVDLVAYRRGIVHLGGAHDLPPKRPPREVGDRLAIGDGASLQPAETCAGPRVVDLLELREHAGLAEACFADDSDDRTEAAIEVRELFLEQRKLFLAANQRRGETIEAAGVSRHRLEAGNLVGLDGRGLALHLDEPPRHRLELSMDEPEGVGADQNLARLCQRLEACGDVRGVAHRSVLGLDRVADESEHSRSRVYADAEVEIEAVLGFDLTGVGHARFLDFEPGANGPLGVILVRDRGTEERQDRIAHQAGHRAAIARHRAVHEGKSAVHHVRPVFRIQLFGDRGRARDVGEKDGREPPLTLDRSRLLDGIPAIAAESCAFRVAVLADRAGQHRDYGFLVTL